MTIADHPKATSSVPMQYNPVGRSVFSMVQKFDVRFGEKSSRFGKFGLLKFGLCSSCSKFGLVPAEMQSAPKSQSVSECFKVHTLDFCGYVQLGRLVLSEKSKSLIRKGLSEAMQL